MLLTEALSCRDKIASVIDEYMSTEHRLNETARRKQCASAIFPTANSTRTGLRLNSCLRGDRPATKLLIHDMGSLLTACTYQSFPFIQKDALKPLHMYIYVSAGWDIGMTCILVALLNNLFKAANTCVKKIVAHRSVLET